MNASKLKTYELIEEKQVDDLNSKGYLLRHIKSGARVLLLENDDNNKVFYIGFRTPPSDSTGLPHILEHSVLCGSKNFPAKDPFVELVKGSLNTFLNAMTYPDKTVYPVASCNDKDFKNLMHVYMDAVFYPNVYNREEIFKQEGWHYELESLDDKIQYNGVVYNEMKGAFSSPEDVLDREILNSLFPDTAYSVESGGDPEVIPELTYEEFLDYHKKYYHPSNSYIYLYGDMDMEERLNWLDSEYLSDFNQIEIDSSIGIQETFDQIVEVVKPYSITEEEPLADNTYLSYNCVIDTSLNKELYLAFQILEYSLLGAPGAPLKQALLDHKIGKDIMSSYENGILQPFFSVISKNANKEQKDAFLDIIRRVLTEQVENGLDHKALRAGINYFEFRYREADFGSYPKGLMYGLQAYDSWLYNEKVPFMHIEANQTFAFLKSQVETGYFEKLMKEYLIDNRHASVVIIEPQRGLTAKKDAKTEEKLDELKKSLTEQELKDLIRQTQALVAYQEEPSTKEELESIPLLSREDIEKKAEDFINTEYKSGDTVMLHHDLFTNGISYLTLLFDMKNVPEHLIPYTGILKAVLGYVDTKNYGYNDLFNEINVNSGGISSSVATYSDAEEKDRYLAEYEIRAKVLDEKIEFAFQMIEEILFTSNLEDEKRLYEIIAMLKSRVQMSLISSGHSTAAVRAMSYFSSTSYFSELTSGISFYRILEELEGDFEKKKTELIANLKALMVHIFRASNLMLDFTGSKEVFDRLESLLCQLKDKLESASADEVAGPFPLEKKNEGFKTASQVQYVAVAGNYRNVGLPYTGALKVLKVIMGYDYLWNNIRVKGGAYGCMNSFSRTGDSYFVSYRDPNLEKTIDVYQGAVDYLKSFRAEERDMTKYIIGTISDMDTPMNPKAKGIRSLAAYLGRYTYEAEQKEREEVLSVTEDIIRSLSEYAEAVLSQDYLCVLGSEEKIKEQEKLFMTVENLISQ